MFLSFVAGILISIMSQDKAKQSSFETFKFPLLFVQLPILRALKDKENVFYDTLKHIKDLMGKFGFSVGPKVIYR